MAKKSQKEKEASAAAKFVAAQIQARKDEEGEQGVEVNFSEVMQQVKGKNAKTKNAEKQDKQSKPKAKQDKPKTEIRETKDDAEKAILTTKEVAAMCGTTPKALRRVLRSKWYNDGIMTHYTWTKDDPILKEIVDHYKAQEKKEAK